MPGINRPPNCNNDGRPPAQPTNRTPAVPAPSSPETPAGGRLSPTPHQIREWLSLPQGTQDPQFPATFPLRDGNGREYDAWVWEFDNAGERRWTGHFLTDPQSRGRTWDPSRTVLRCVAPDPAEAVENEVERRIVTCTAHGRYYCPHCFTSQSGYYGRCILIALRYHDPATCPICPNH